MRATTFFARCALLLLLPSCGDDGAGQQDRSFKVMVISDTHVTASDGPDARRLSELVRLLNEGAHPGVELLLLSGDISDTLYDKYDPQNPSKMDFHLGNAFAALRGLKSVKYFPAPGNHDYKFDASLRAETPAQVEQVRKLWQQTTGFDVYHQLEYGGFRFVALDNFRGRWLGNGNYFDEQQLEWLDQVLGRSMPTVLYLHYPIRTDHDLPWTLDKSNIVPRSQARFFDVVKRHQQQIMAVFVGHGHLWVRDRLFDSIQVFETGSFGKTLPTIDSFHLLDCDPDEGRVTVTNGRGATYFEAK